MAAPSDMSGWARATKCRASSASSSASDQILDSSVPSDESTTGVRRPVPAAASPVALSLVGSRCPLGPLEEVGGAAVEAGHDDGADPHGDRAVAHQVVRVALGEATIDECRGVGDGCRVDAERSDREHVGADSCDVGVGRKRGADRGADAAQHLVGDLGAEPLVDALEVDDVGDEHRDRMVIRHCVREHVILEHRDQSVARQQTGQRIDRLVQDVASTVGGVVDRLAEQRWALVGVDPRHVGSPPADLAVGSHDAMVHGDGRAARRPGHELLHPELFLGVDEVVHRQPGDLRRRAGEEPAHGRVGTPDDTIEPEDHQPDR